MKRIRSLNWYQKGIMLFMFLMVVVFTVMYPITIAREGFAYKNAILIPNQENGNTVYSGKIDGGQASFTIYADKSVIFRYKDKTYGPYIAKEDPSAVPKENVQAEYMTGVELLCGENVIFRGGILDGEGYRWLYHEDGSLENIDISVVTNYGTVMDETGKVKDPMEPSPSTIIDLMSGPKLTHKGEWFGWISGVMICMITAIFILFADEIFRLHLIFRIRNADEAEPSEWEIAGRYISWTVLPIMALILFVIGIQ